MHISPRTRRLHSDLKSLQHLAAHSSIFSFTPYNTPPDFYVLRFSGPGCHKPDPQSEVLIRHDHEVHIRLGANYPRTMPDLAWKTPIFHPNISSTGVVCLGGYGTHWAPSLTLDELCSMLWDMLRLANYDESSPYNRDAAAWAKHQTEIPFPLDPRPLRDQLTPSEKTEPLEIIEAQIVEAPPRGTGFQPATQPPPDDIIFLE